MVAALRQGLRKFKAATPRNSPRLSRTDIRPCKNLSGVFIAAASPKYPSPLSYNPPVQADACTPSSCEDEFLDDRETNGSSRMACPVPIRGRLAMMGQFDSTDSSKTMASSRRPRHPDSIPSPSSSQCLDGPELATPERGAHRRRTSSSSNHTISLSPTQRKLSTSHSLAGSYTLSLLSSRMSHAHTPHTLPSAFTVQIAATGFSTGSQHVEPRLRSPPHVKVPFEARWYDLDGGPGGAAVGTPWVGCVDLDKWYTERQERAEASRGRSAGTAATSLKRDSSALSSVARQTRDRRRSPSVAGSSPTRSGLSAHARRASGGHIASTSSSTSKSSQIDRYHSTQTHTIPHGSDSFPGYELAQQGLLQLVIKNDVQAIKVFLIKYDLNALQVGGKLLVRERVYEPVPPVKGAKTMSTASSASSIEAIGVSSLKRREVLRSAVELQFTCIEAPIERTRKRRKRHTESSTTAPPASSSLFDESHGSLDSAVPTGEEEHQAKLGASIEGDTWTLDDGPQVSNRRQGPGEGCHITPARQRLKTRKAYYLTKHVRMVFPSLSGTLSSLDSKLSFSARDSSTPSDTHTKGGTNNEHRTERFIEVINPAAVHTGMSPSEIKKARRSSFASESWEGMRDLLRQQMEEEQDEEEEVSEDWGCDADSADMGVEVNTIISPADYVERSSERLDTPLPPIKFSRTPTPLHSTRAITSLLTASLGKSPSGGSSPVPFQNASDIEDCHEDVVKLGPHQQETPSMNHWQKEWGLETAQPLSPPPVTSPLDKKRSLWPEDESERLLSESLQRLGWRNAR